MLKISQSAFWRRIPPAVFPPILGLIGMALAWRRAGEVLGFGVWIGNAILCVVILIYVVATLCCLAKCYSRPAATVQDLGGLPGRSGMAAMTLAGMLIAAGLAPYFPETARAVLFLGLAGHLILLIIVVVILFGGPTEQRKITPAWHLTFVGFIVVPFTAIPLGMTGLAQVSLIAPMMFALVLIVVSLDQARRYSPPPALRPLIAIHLAPLSLFATVAYQLGHIWFAVTLAVLAIAFGGFLLAKARWLTAGNFTPLWGAFTFPSAAFAVVLLTLSPLSRVFTVLGVVVLLAASIIVAVIAFRIFRMWPGELLAEKTNAARV